MDRSIEEVEVSIQTLESTSERAIRRHRGWYLAQGILFIVIGLLSFVLPVVTVIGVEVILAVLLIISGAYQTYQGVTDRSGWLIVSGVLSLIVGGIMLLMPLAGAVAVATVIALFLLFEGIVEIVLALQIRSTNRWGWLMASGILSIVLAIILLIGWPEQTVILAGIFLGINFLLYGIAVLAVVAGTRRKHSPAS